MERGRFYQQFGERSGSVNAGSQEARSLERVPKEQSWYEQDIPYEQLVTAIRYFVERESKRAGIPMSKFYKAEWLGNEVRNQTVAAYNGDAPEEEQIFLKELLVAWDALAHTRYVAKSDFRRNAITEIEEYVQATNNESVTLPPKAVKFIDAMAEVSGIPRKRGEVTIDLRPFVKR